MDALSALREDWRLSLPMDGSAEPHQIQMELQEVKLTALGLRIVGRAPLRSLIARLDRQLKDWSLAVGRDGRVEARNVRCPKLRLTVEPAVHDHRVEVELRGVRWRRVQVNLPAWLRLRRSVELPPLPLGLVVVDARRRGDAVDLRLTVPSVSRTCRTRYFSARRAPRGRCR